MKRLLYSRLTLSFLGLIVRGVGVGFLILAMLGTNPAALLQEGFSQITHLPYGFASLIANLMILLIVYMIDSKYINISSILAIVLIGYAAEVTSSLYSFIGSSYIVLRTVYFVLGCMFMSLGTVVYIQADLGVGALDVLPEIIYDKTRLSYSTCRLLCDSLYILCGLYMGANVGIGTLLSVVLCAPMMSWFRSILFFNLSIQEL